jgi:N-methylhydantoinase A
VLRPLAAEALPAIRAALDAAHAEAAAALDRPGAPAAVELTAALDLRYAGQSYELTVPLSAPSPPAGERGPGGEGDLARARRDFDALHEARFGHHDPAAPVEVVAARATATRRGLATELLSALRDAAAARHSPVATSPTATTDLWIDGRRRDAALHDRDALHEGDVVSGPALITQLDATTYVAPGWRARVDAAATLLLERA